MKIFIVIPAYNEEGRIIDVLEDFYKSNLSIIVVNDGSSDLTSKHLKDAKVTLINHNINLGKGAALKTGCLAAWELGAEGVILVDADGQHKVSDLPAFLKHLKTKKYDIIFGSRSLNSSDPLIRVLGNRIASALIPFMFGIYISDPICGYRALTKKAFYKIDWQSSGYAVETEMIVKTAKAGLKYCEVPVQTVYYDKFKGVTILDAFNVLFNVFKWRLNR